MRLGQGGSPKAYEVVEEGITQRAVPRSDILARRVNKD